MTSATEIKKTGATFTPKPLADFLASRISSSINKDGFVSVLDPACGDGELLLSIANQLSHRNQEFSLSGFDSNSQYLSTAHSRLANFTNTPVNLVEGDFLDSIHLIERQISIDFDLKKHQASRELVDIVIANPPYVRTQVLGAEKSKILASKFNLKGRVDLYYAFLVALTSSLKLNGILGVITSNRYLSTKSGESVRKFLVENYDILEVIDLGDTKLFEAAVLPALLIGRKKENNYKVPITSFIKLYEELNNYQGTFQLVNSVYDILRTSDEGYFQVDEKKYKKTKGTLNFGTIKSNTWEMLSDNETEWARKIDTAASCRIGDLFKVKVGIKTTADNVFISEDWGRLKDRKPESELLKSLLSQENIRPWGVTENENLKVLYPHYSLNGTKRTISIDSYPKAKEYFLSHEEKLRSRKYLIEAGREWFEIWVSHHPDIWSLPKLVFPDISAIPRFCFDNEGHIVNGNCYWIAARTDIQVRQILLIQGIANSKLMTKYHDLTFNNKLYSGRRRYLTQYVERYPLPNLNSVAADKIIELVNTLNSCTDIEHTKDLTYRLEEIVAESFGVSPIHHLEQLDQPSQSH